ncbi:MAG: hypothetical protein MMC33_002615 [Icmadophila ericetorum]|nr:hypothetical protein [Icmadophila ericetorum]
MTFNGNISIKQTGHAMVHIDKYDEDYLIPIPGAKVKGLFSGRPYPELGGTYHIISSTGLVSEITFSGTGFFSGSRNSFEAKIYQRDDKAKSPLYTARGQWNGKFTIHDGANDNDIETCDLGTYQPAPLTIPDEAEQDSWETRRAWKDVIQALKRGDMRGTVMEKSKLEEAQRALRRKEAANGTPWQPLFFSPLQGNYPLFDGLASAVGWPLEKERTKGVWKVNREKAEHAEKLKPYHGIVTPMG